MEEVKKDVAFCTRGTEYDSTAIKFVNKEKLTAISATKVLKSRRWVFFLTWRGVVDVGEVPPKVEAALLAIMLLGAGDEVKMFQAAKTQLLNWWGFGLKLFLLMSEEYVG